MKSFVFEKLVEFSETVFGATGNCQWLIVVHRAIWQMMVVVVVVMRIGLIVLVVVLVVRIVQLHVMRMIRWLLVVCKMVGKLLIAWVLGFN
jgi:hypothetical protein